MRAPLPRAVRAPLPRAVRAPLPRAVTAPPLHVVPVLLLRAVLARLRHAESAAVSRAEPAPVHLDLFSHFDLLRRFVSAAQYRPRYSHHRQCPRSHHCRMVGPAKIKKQIHQMPSYLLPFAWIEIWSVLHDMCAERAQQIEVPTMRHQDLRYHFRCRFLRQKARLRSPVVNLTPPIHRFRWLAELLARVDQHVLTQLHASLQISTLLRLASASLPPVCARARPFCPVFRR